ncbi:MAG: antitoxin VapB family protein [Candidatus Aramenus sp.]|nr:antitoxin VapB family protein [Candidatus Aramenus sp.]
MTTHNEAYESLLKEKSEGKSFSDVMLRLIRGRVRKS